MDDRPLTLDDINGLLSETMSDAARNALTELKSIMGSSKRRLDANEIIASIGDAWTLDPARIVRTYGQAGERFGGPKARIKDQPVLALDISGSLITHYAAVVVDEQVLLADLGHASKFWRSRGISADFKHRLSIVTYDPEEGKCIFRSGTPDRLDDPRGYFFFQSRSAFLSFDHFVQDLMLQTPFYEDCCAIAGSKLVPLITNSSVLINGQPFIGRLLEILFEALVTEESDVVYLNGRSVVTEKCYTSTVAYKASDFTASRYAAGRIRKTMAAADLPRQPVAGVGSKVWITRRGGATRRKAIAPSDLDNEDLLDDLASACGFSVVDPYRLDAEEILGIMDGAEVLAGVHGPNLLHTVLCPKARTLIECKMAPWTLETPCLMAEAFGLEVQRIDVVPSVTGQGYSVDLGRLSDVLRNA